MEKVVGNQRWVVCCEDVTGVRGAGDWPQRRREPLHNWRADSSILSRNHSNRRRDA